MNSNTAEFILDVLDLAKNRHYRKAQKGSRAAVAAQKIADRYGELKAEMDFESAARIASVEFLISVTDN